MPPDPLHPECRGRCVPVGQTGALAQRHPRRKFTDSRCYTKPLRPAQAGCATAARRPQREANATREHHSHASDAARATRESAKERRPPPTQGNPPKEAPPAARGASARAARSANPRGPPTRRPHGGAHWKVMSTYT